MAAKGVIEPWKLPPTRSAVDQHCFRVYYQCNVWKTLDDEMLDPSDYGWKKTEEGYEPIKTLEECAPGEILNFVRCKCKTNSSSQA